MPTSSFEAHPNMFLWYLVLICLQEYVFLFWRWWSQEFVLSSYQFFEMFVKNFLEVMEPHIIPYFIGNDVVGVVWNKRNSEFNRCSKFGILAQISNNFRSLCNIHFNKEIGWLSIGWYFKSKWDDDNTKLPTRIWC